MRVRTLDVGATDGTVIKNPDQPTYKNGSTVTLTAAPNEGYHFVEWSGDIKGPDNPTAVTMNSNKAAAANFAINTYTLQINAENGAVAKDPDQPTYTHASTVALTAAPNEGYKFVGWSGDVTSTDNPVILIMDSDKAAAANFVANKE
jgi:hypothetical protein